MENKIPYGDKSFNLDYVTQLIKERLDAKDPGVKSRNPDYVAKQIIKTRKASRRLRKVTHPISERWRNSLNTWSKRSICIAVMR